MKIRSITCFCNPLDSDFDEILRKLTVFVTELKEDFEKKGWEVQTTRLATTPFGQYTKNGGWKQKIQGLEGAAADAGFTYLSIGPARLYHREEFAKVPEILSATENVFLSGTITHPMKGICLDAVSDSAIIIKKAATITPDGFTNLRFCATSLVKPFTPFFPASFSYGGGPSFALAMECADAAVSAVESAKSVSDGRRKLLSALNEASVELEKISLLNGRQHGIRFRGFDFSLAPFPEEWCSIGRAMESLGVEQLGFFGSLAAASVMMDILDSGKWARAGFNGLMLPVLEDSTLAARSESAAFSIKDLLMYSAVCGTGLDTVPLPGDISPEQIESLLMDISALSLRLDKPLTARLMPVPGMKSGEKTKFDFAFFKNGGVMDFPGKKLNGALDSSEWIQIRKR